MALTGEELMSFLNTFKKTIETTMTNVEKSINRNIDEKLDRITNDARRAEIRQEEVNKKTAEKIDRLETNLKRMQFQRMRSNTLGGGERDVECQPTFQLENRREREVSTRGEKEKNKESKEQGGDA